MIKHAPLNLYKPLKRSKELANDLPTHQGTGRGPRERSESRLWKVDFWIFDSVSDGSDQNLDHPKSKSQFFIPFLGFSDSVPSPKKFGKKVMWRQKIIAIRKKIFWTKIGNFRKFWLRTCFFWVTTTGHNLNELLNVRYIRKPLKESPVSGKFFRFWPSSKFKCDSYEFSKLIFLTQIFFIGQSTNSSLWEK